MFVDYLCDNCHINNNANTNTNNNNVMISGLIVKDCDMICISQVANSSQGPN